MEFYRCGYRLEYRIGKPLSEILGIEGSSVFQTCQQSILQLLIKQNNVVISTDVSLICDEKNREVLKNEFVIFLKTSTSTQIERIARNPMPLLPTDLTQLFNYLHENREHHFESLSNLIIDGNDSNIDNLISTAILKTFGENMATAPSSKISLDRKDMVLFHKLLGTAVYLPHQQAICLKLLAQGKSSKEIASLMNISHRTMEGYIAKTIDELGCLSSKELIALYHEQP